MGNPAGGNPDTPVNRKTTTPKKKTKPTNPAKPARAAKAARAAVIAGGASDGVGARAHLANREVDVRRWNAVARAGQGWPRVEHGGHLQAPAGALPEPCVDLVCRLGEGDMHASLRKGAV